MKWQFKSTQLSPEKIIFQVMKEQKLQSFREVVRQWVNDEEFIAFFNRNLADLPYTSFYFELPPMTEDQQDTPFEFVIIKSHSLHSKTPDVTAFREYFDNRKEAVHFTNLGGDALLIAPCPVKGKHYPHIGEFVRNAPSSQVVAFWKQVGRSYLQELTSGRKLWLSTAGDGVTWLHMRIDRFPKYYQHQPYKN